MLILSLETATDQLGVAVVAGSRVLAEATYNMGRRHGELLLVLVQETLQRLNIAAEELDGIAVSLGPGSFTGVRIGLAAAKTLAFATGKSLIGVDTLTVLAASAGLVTGSEAGTVCALLDAGRGEVYAAAFVLSQTGPDWEKAALSPTVAPIGAWLQHARTLPGPIWFTGDGAGGLWETVAQEMPDAQRVPPACRYPRPAVTGSIAQVRLAQGRVDDPAKLVPLYLRRSPGERTG